GSVALESCNARDRPVKLASAGHAGTEYGMGSCGLERVQAVGMDKDGCACAKQGQPTLQRVTVHSDPMTAPWLSKVVERESPRRVKAVEG
ncbi:hypothetical protein LTR16_005217, partial [Cryomyces antarcticus]